MSTTTVSINNLNRIGGLAAIVGLLLMFGYAALPLLLGVGMLVMAVYYFALYRADSSVLNLVATLSAVGGSLALFVTGVAPHMAQNAAMFAAFFLPSLLAGLAANGQAGFPRALAIIGIVGGVFGVLNFIVVTLAGGDYTNPNNPALTPFVWATYIPTMLATLVWLVWGGIHMFRKA